PVAGDQGLALDPELEGEWRPAVWDLSTGERRNLEFELTGEVYALDWWPDGSALLLKQRVEGRHRLFRLELASGELRSIDTEPGVILAARVRPGGPNGFLHAEGPRPRAALHETGP